MTTNAERNSAEFPACRRLAAGGMLAALGAAIAIALAAGPAAARVGNIDLVSRPEGRVLPAHARDGRLWVVGTPGQEYAIRVCNQTDGRVLAVMSVDGVNVISGDTASPAQSGYVLSAYQCADIAGWRKNLSSTAAFYFTELPDAYATRTGRPDNVGVIGVAFFRERAQPLAWRDLPAKIASGRSDQPLARQESAAAGSAAGSLAGSAAENRAEAASASRDELARMPQAPAPAAKIGTGHGRREYSQVQTTQFEREDVTPNETIALHYDRLENLVAMGILPPPAIARSANPFPAWSPRFAPDPPRR